MTRDEIPSAGEGGYDPVAPPQQPSWLRGSFVRVMIVMTALLFVAMVAVLYYQSITVKEPTSVILIEADERLSGAVVVVEGIKLDRPYKLPLEEKNGYNARVFLQPGSYRVRIRQEGQEADLYSTEVLLGSNRIFKPPLLEMGLTTQPTADISQAR